MSTAIRVKNYILGKTLGVGSFGKVKMAEHELTGHKVAIKILNKKKVASLNMDEKVWREITILKLFMHPHIIRLYEVIESPTDIFVVMEYVQGGELFDYIVSKGRLTEGEARLFFQQVVSAIDYCHQYGVVHRDLKPENLLLDDQKRVKVADFGLSNLIRDGEFLKTSCGSPNYAAPEVISGKLYAGPEVDVWSCGVILYALLCGNLPFDDESIPALFKKIKGGIYTLPTFLSEGARDIIPKMLVVDPLKRATLEEVRNHPWVKKDLPEYLATPKVISPERMIAPGVGSSMPEDQRPPIEDIVDPFIVAELQKVGFRKEEILESMREAIFEGERNSISVAYYLIMDNTGRDPKKLRVAKKEADRKGGESGSAPIPISGQRRRQDEMAFSFSPQSPSSGGGSFSRAQMGSPTRSTEEFPEFASSPSVVSSLRDRVVADSFAMRHRIQPGSFRDSLANSSGMISNIMPPSLQSQGGVKAVDQSPAVTLRSWNLGVPARMRIRAPEVMKEVYRCLRARNWKWKSISPYQLRCIFDPSSERGSVTFDPEYGRMSTSVPPGFNMEERMRNSLSEMNIDVTPSSLQDGAGNVGPSDPNRIKMAVNLFRLSEPGRYLVDFQHLGGNMIEFLYQVGDLRRDLRF